jgi:spermidine/putrescine-binding protein
MIKTAKIKNVKDVSEPYGKYKTLYHNIEMDNGDKINIGKVKEQQVGWELTYKIVEQGQQEYNKAKSVQPEGGFTPSKSASGNFSKDKNKQITELACLKAAASISAAYIGQGHKVTPEDVINLKNTFTQDILREEKPVAVEKSNNNPNTLSNGEVVLDDMPF